MGTSLSQKYTSNKKIRFTDISDRIGKGTARFAIASKIYAEIIENVLDTFQNTRKYKQNVVDSINITSYAILADGNANYKLGSIDYDISNYPDLESRIAPWYLTIDSIEWNIDPVLDLPKENEVENLGIKDPSPNNKVQNTSPKSVKVDLEPPAKSKKVSSSTQVSKTDPPTDKTNLYLQPPRYPQIDLSQLYRTGYDKANSKMYGIFKSFPDIPARQRDISCTTDPEKMSESDFIKLFPNVLIRTRNTDLYQSYDDYDIEYDPELGAILPIGNGKYTREQLIDNIIMYPHLFSLTRDYKDTGITISNYRDDGTVHHFYTHIEIDGQLYPIEDVWEMLEDTKNIPPREEYMHDYVIRRYLLERDIDHIEHKYPMICDLQPYVTLFMPPEGYLKRGHIQNLTTDAAELGRKCVQSRVHYHITNNPMIRRMNKDPEVPQGKVVRDPCVFASYCVNRNCNEACIEYVQSNYLFMRNNILGHSNVFAMDPKKLTKFTQIFDKAANHFSTYIEKNDTSQTAEIFAYIAVCNTWKNSALRCRTYTLNYFHYLDLKKGSWTGVKTDELEYMEIWVKTARVLIISNLDFVRFNDFACQELLGKLEMRRYDPNFTTIVVSPPLSSLVGEGMFFPKLTAYLNRGIIK